MGPITDGQFVTRVRSCLGEVGATDAEILNAERHAGGPELRHLALHVLKTRDWVRHLRSLPAPTHSGESQP